MTSKAGWSRPQWVMLGVDMPDYPPDRQVMVVASKRLSLAELDARYREPDGLGEFNLAIMPVSYSLTVTMDDVMLAFGATYGEAIQHLFKAWSPDARPAIAPATPELTL